MNNLKNQLKEQLDKIIIKIQNFKLEQYSQIVVGLLVILFIFMGVKTCRNKPNLKTTEAQKEVVLDNTENTITSCDFNLMEYGINGNVDMINECFTKSAYINELGNRVITIINLSETIKIVCAEKNGELLTVVQVTSGSTAIFAPNLKHRLSIDESWMQTEITITDKVGDVLTYTFKK